MTPIDGHPSEHVLAELAGGVLEARDAGAIEDHVRSCSACRDTLSRLDEVQAALRAAPRELPIPSHVSARLTAALAAEATGPSLVPAQAQAAEPDPASGAPDNVVWFRRRMPRLLAAAASVAVIGVGGYVIGSGGGSPVDSTAGSAADSADDSATVQERSAAESQLGETAAEGVPYADGLEAAPADAVLQRIDEVWRQRSSLQAGCGQELADDLGQSLVGSAQLDTGVLVVLDTGADGTLAGWTLPQCSSLPAQALGEPVMVPAPE